MVQIPYATQWIDEEDVKEVIEVLRSGYLTQGPRIAEFEKKVADYCGAKYAVVVNSGTAALHAACFAAGIKPGDEVITSPITFVASANCILYCGGKPVFADIQADTINIDPKEIEKKVGSKTKAVIPVHFAGHPCDLEEIADVAKKKKLIVIEDAAHALGAEYKGARIGSCKYSDMAIFCFHATKIITTGEGGMILTNNEEYYRKLLMFRTHGITRDPKIMKNNNEGDWYYEMQYLGYNYRLTDFQCALGIRQMDKLEGFVARRREIAGKYNQAFRDIDGIGLPVEKEQVKSSWHLYPIQIKNNRRKVFEDLRSEGIGGNVHYIPVYLQPYYQKLGYRQGLCRLAEEYYWQCISLPMYPKLTDSDQDYVIKIFCAVLSSVNMR
ncbi:UDP-4-amino-4,6-dideoxy-N-acetyl-beta-L-altrosamine transaminase [Candidatus Saganbacteria bacterium]|nr:UDP-4-amino-4,6-dideoxy-N-acetyl-beta-L-altrosamine transaminase [Candidatus Saganbacteria bacterium]